MVLSKRCHFAQTSLGVWKVTGEKGHAERYLQCQRAFKWRGIAVFQLGREQRLQLVQPRVRVVGRGEACRKRHLLDDAVKCAIRVIGRSVAGHPSVINFTNFVDGSLRDAGFPDACLATDGDHLALTRARQRPAFEHQFDLPVSPDDGGQCSRLARGQPK